MRFAVRSACASRPACACLFLLTFAATGTVAFAQLPPPGDIFNLMTVHPGVLSTYEAFSTNFVADNSSEFVSFAFRETPAFFAFDDASVSTGGGPNLLSDPGFESASFGQNCNHNNTLGCPAGWGAWIQPVDVSAIGQVATSSDHYGCGANGPHSGTAYWCDGSVQGYDAVYQLLNGLSVGSTYNVNWFLGDNSGQLPINTTGDGIDMLVYAGDALPVGSVSIGGPGGTPEPATLLLLGSGLLGIGLFRRKKRT